MNHTCETQHHTNTHAHTHTHQHAHVQFPRWSISHRDPRPIINLPIPLWAGLKPLHPVPGRVHRGAFRTSAAI